MASNPSLPEPASTALWRFLLIPGATAQRQPWRTLLSAVASLAVVGALALIAAFLLVTSARAQGKDLRIGYQKSASLFVLQKA